MCLAQSTRTCSLHFRLFLRRRSGVTVDFSDTSSDELEEHNAGNSMLELVCHTHIGIYMEALVGAKELGIIALSCHFVLDILCDKSEVRCAQWHAPLPWKKVSIGPHPTPRPARLTAVLGSRSFPRSASSDARQKKVGKTFQVGGAGAERFRCVEMLLQSSFIGRGATGFHDTSFQHTMKCDLDIRKNFVRQCCVFSTRKPAEFRTFFVSFSR